MEVLTSHQAVHHIPHHVLILQLKICIHSACLCLLVGAFNLFMFTVIIDMYLLPFC